eukprot:TRINITY_DN131_c0_g1_i1.p1 TRINITY_DN131_c0_g1~~TRINITY_DN131_c0_g1_i1.p1  ORF type:complete len:168 (-),score=48.56 TRINITY_DN131_c0_g1_i1:573-1076(-)
MCIRDRVSTQSTWGVDNHPKHNQNTQIIQKSIGSTTSMNVVKDILHEIATMKPRKLLQQLITLALVVASAFAIWKSLMVITCSESPVVVVLSESMEPAYYRGDILFLTFYDDPIETGDVVVFKLKRQDIPIVHRAVTIQPKYAIAFRHLISDHASFTPPGRRETSIS